MRTLSRPRFALALALIALATSAAAPPRTSAARHLRLVRSEPAKDTTLTAPPKTLKLYFSEAVKPAVAGVRLIASDSTTVTLGPLSVGSDGTPAPLLVPVTGAMRAGTYRVLWRVTGADGHTLTGDFAFRIRLGPPPHP